MKRNLHRAIFAIEYLIFFFCILCLPINNAFCNTTDNDTTLAFYWSAATGNVAKYNVYLSTNGGSYLFIGYTSSVPTISNPYIVPMTAVNGSSYRIKVEAVDPNGIVGPMSEPSDTVLCVLQYAGEATKTITLNLMKGWNLISWPGIPVISDIQTIMSVNPNIALIIIYDTIQKKYVPAQNIEFGKSYFIGTYNNTQIGLKYYPRDSLVLEAKGGWNPLGSLPSSISALNISSNPDNKISLVVYWNCSTPKI